MGVRMKSSLKKYWKQLLFFGAITAYYIVGIAPDMTWISLGGDAPDYVMGTTYMWAVRPTGYPTYILIGWLFQRLPFNPFWNLGLLSALSSAATCVFIFLTIKLLVGRGSRVGKSVVPSTSNSSSLQTLPLQLAPYLGALAYAGAFVVWTQSVIPEVYTFTTLLMIIGTYFTLKGRYYVAAVALTIGLGTHLLIVPVIILLLVYVFLVTKDGKLVSKLVGIGLLGFLPYLQTQLAVRGLETTFGLDTVGKAMFSATGLIFGLPIIKTWDRIREAVPVILASVSVAPILFIYLKRSREVVMLLVLALLFYAFYSFSNIPMWTTYLVPGIAFTAILVGIGLARLSYKKLAPVFLVVPVIFMGLNLIYYDIGRTVDRNFSARQFYNQMFLVPDGSLFYITSYGEPWLLTYYFCVENNYSFDFVYEGKLRWDTQDYTKLLESRGLVVPNPLDKYGDKIPTGYATWDTEMFLADFSKLNGRELYVCRSEGETFEENPFIISKYSPASR